MTREESLKLLEIISTIKTNKMTILTFYSVGVLISIIFLAILSYIAIYKGRDLTLRVLISIILYSLASWFCIFSIIVILVINCLSKFDTILIKGRK